MERFYIYLIERNNIYFEEKNEILKNLNPNDLEKGLFSLPPSFFMKNLSNIIQRL